MFMMVLLFVGLMVMLMLVADVYDGVAVGGVVDGVGVDGGVDADGVVCAGGRVGDVHGGVGGVPVGVRCVQSGSAVQKAGTFL